MSNRLLFRRAIRLRHPALMPASRVRGWTALRGAWRRYRSRQRIADLNGYLLKDIGVSFAEAEAEANKLFWRE